jgi:hypothetical protein
VAVLGFFPTHITADAAFDAWYTYQMVAYRKGNAAIPLNTHGHPDSQRALDGVPLCAKGLRMHPTFQFSHTYGYCSQRFRCPLLFPQANGETCDHAQFAKGKGCVKDLIWERSGQMRVTLDRDGPLYHATYDQRTSTERINSQSKELGIGGEKRKCYSPLFVLPLLVVNGIVRLLDIKLTRLHESAPSKPTRNDDASRYAFAYHRYCLKASICALHLYAIIVNILRTLPLVPR